MKVIQHGFLRFQNHCFFCHFQLKSKVSACQPTVWNTPCVAHFRRVTGPCVAYVLHSVLLDTARTSERTAERETLGIGRYKLRIYYYYY